MDFESETLRQLHRMLLDMERCLHELEGRISKLENIASLEPGQLPPSLHELQERISKLEDIASLEPVQLPPPKPTARKSQKSKPPTESGGSSTKKATVTKKANKAPHTSFRHLLKSSTKKAKVAATVTKQGKKTPHTSFRHLLS